MEKLKARVQVAVAIIQRPEHEVLVARRHSHVHQGGLLEFPGGKIERGESPETALKRECFEELGIQVTECEFLMETKYDYHDKLVSLIVYKVTEYHGEPEGKEGQPLMWRRISELDQSEFPAANAAIVDRIKE